MDKEHKSRLHFITTLATVYIIIGFAWWSVLLLRKNEETWQLHIENLRLTMKAENKYVDDKTMQLTSNYAVLMQRHNRQQKMIWGEGSFLFLGLLIGVWVINRSYNKEMELTQQRQNFLLSVTHELKSPLASISLVLQTIRKRNIDEEKKQHLTSNALKEADRLNELVNNILLSTKLDSAYEINPEAFNLIHLITDLVEKYQIKFPKILFEVHAEEIPLMYADRQGIVSVISNLIENGAKYAGENACVYIKVQYTDDKFTIDVCDNGLGVPLPERKKIFKKFYRVGNEMTRKTKGTGLGLYIVSQIVKVHKGSIRILDNTPTGTIFRVVLPAGNQPAIFNFRHKETVEG